MSTFPSIASTRIQAAIENVDELVRDGHRDEIAAIRAAIESERLANMLGRREEVIVIMRNKQEDIGSRTQELRETSALLLQERNFIDNERLRLLQEAHQLEDHAEDLRHVRAALMPTTTRYNELVRGIGVQMTHCASAIYDLNRERDQAEGKQATGARTFKRID